jgi:hypothetical protein
MTWAAGIGAWAFAGVRKNGWPMRDTPGTGVVLDEGRLNLLLRYGNKLVVTRDPAGEVIRCVVSGLEEVVPVELFRAYLANGWIEDVARGVRFAITAAGAKRLK